MKPAFDLLPAGALWDDAYLMAWGRGKHRNVSGDEPWCSIPMDDHFAALMRHLMSHRMGDTRDVDSGESHLVHALCRLMFMAEIERLEEAKKVAETLGPTEIVTEASCRKTIIPPPEPPHGWKEQ